MSRQALSFAALAIVLAVAQNVHADDLRVRMTAVQPLAQPEAGEIGTSTQSRFRAQTAAADVTPADASAVMMSVYPIGGTSGQDIYLPYFVDLDPSSSILDYNCGAKTFGGHTGHDAYVRGFSEQDIGVPVFAVLDGVVSEVRDGQPDRNTTNDPAALPNFIAIRHSNGYETQYVHLKSGSMLVRKGDPVVAGQQIALIGSSGPSTGPHLHFQLTRNGEPIEPMSGPCRLGPSLFTMPPAVPSTTTALGGTFSRTAYDGTSFTPFDTLPHTGTYTLGSNHIYARVDLANLPANSEYVLSITAPDGTVRAGQSSIVTKYQLALASVWWTVDVALNQIGTWKLAVNINGSRVIDMAFQVVGSQQITNRAPRATTVSIEPYAIYPNSVAVCRATGDLLLDPDYDVIRYHYVWTVNGAIVRDVTSAVRSDAIARTYSTPGANIGCSITVSDAISSSATTSAFANVLTFPRRRAVAH